MPERTLVFGSSGILTMAAKRFCAQPADYHLKESCRSAPTRLMSPAARRHGQNRSVARGTRWLSAATLQLPAGFGGSLPESIAVTTSSLLVGLERVTALRRSRV